MRKACRLLPAFAILASPALGWAQSLGQIPLPPANPPAPHGPILIYALFNWAVTALILVLMLREAIRKRTLFPIVFLIAGSLAAFVEPVFDGNIHVLFIYPPGTHPSWHFYNVPYPWYELIGNSCLAGPIYWIYFRLRKGASASELWLYFALAWALDGIQELPGTAMGAYVYFGPQPFRFLNWPVWVGMLACLGYVLPAYAAYTLEKILPKTQLYLAQIILMPVIIYGSEVIAWPMWITINGGKSVEVAEVAAIVSLAFTAFAYHVWIQAYAATRPAIVPRTAMAPMGLKTQLQG
jgi:hypothetical protein